MSNKKFKDLVFHRFVESDNLGNILRSIKITEYPVKIVLSIKCLFNRPSDNISTERYYNHRTTIVKTENNIPAFYRQVRKEFNHWLAEVQLKGSGFVFNKILRGIIKVHKTKSLNGSSYVPLRFKSSSIINIKNSDNKCFLYCLLAKLYPVDKDPQRPSKYKEYLTEINMEGIEYPVSISDIPKVEKQNRFLSINVFGLNDLSMKGSIYPIHISNYKNREEVIDLLYVENHYILIKDLDKYMYNGCNRNSKIVCRRCLSLHRTYKALENHLETCEKNTPAKEIMPLEEYTEFKNHHFKIRIPFVVYSDFESTNKQYKNKIAKQEVNSFGLYLHSDYPNIVESEYITYKGNDAIEQYVKNLMLIYSQISLVYSKKSKPRLSEEEEEEFQNSTNCYICSKKLDEDNKVREHNHLSRKYRGASCQACNSKEGKATKVIPILFHNGSNYDFHFLITELMKYEDKFHKVKVLAKTAEEYISIDYGNSKLKLRFLDSYKFLGSSLDGIVKSLKEFPILDSMMFYNEEKGITETKYKTDLLKGKGIYPYEYIDSIERLEEKQLPPFIKNRSVQLDKKLYNIDKENFLYKYILKWYNYKRVSPWYSSLKRTDIRENEYNKAIEVWNYYGCKTLLDYHNLYLKTDVLLLADAFEQYRRFNLTNHQIDPCYCFTNPGLTWQCGLRFTNVKLENLRDNEMFHLFEKGIRGGFSGVLGRRYVESEGLLYVDANNLYGYAMCQPLPYCDFQWETDSDYYLNIPSGRGCIIECDLEYTNKLKNSRYPLAPEHITPSKEMLSNYQLALLGDKPLGGGRKLMLTLRDKKKYVVHHRILKKYLSLGMKVAKVHRTISFKEEAWLKPYIDFNTENRKNATTDFEKDLFKNSSNSFSGKTMENVRDRTEVKLFTSKEIIKKKINNPKFKDSVIFNDDLVAILSRKGTVKLDKPIYLGQAILDIAKLLMYEFYYDIIEKVWPDTEILYQDTDSLVLSINSENDIYEDIKNKTLNTSNIFTKDHPLYLNNEPISKVFDTSNYPKDHFLYSEENKKVVGKFKDELGGDRMEYFLALKSKSYTYEKAIRLKGISKSTIKTDIRPNDFKYSLFNSITLYNNNYSLNSKNHEMFMNKINKISISPYDDKRYISDDGINTKPYE